MNQIKVRSLDNKPLSYDNVDTDDHELLDYIVRGTEDLTKMKVVDISGEYNSDIDLLMILSNGDKIGITYEYSPYPGYNKIAGRTLGVIEVEYKSKDRTIRKTDEQVQVNVGNEIFDILKSILIDIGMIDKWSFHITLPIDTEGRYDIDTETYGYTNIKVGFNSKEEAKNWLKTIDFNIK